jgi:hypothetical protein
MTWVRCQLRRCIVVSWLLELLAALPYPRHLLATLTLTGWLLVVQKPTDVQLLL